MVLSLSVIKYPAGVNASLAPLVLDRRGATIGRGANNDWVLPDPDRFLSAHHAAVCFENGGFLLVDTSTNGVFVNGELDPLGSHRVATLRDGDRLAIGDYLLLVTLNGAIDDKTQRRASPLMPEPAPAPIVNPSETRWSAPQQVAQASAAELNLPANSGPVVNSPSEASASTAVAPPEPRPVKESTRSVVDVPREPESRVSRISELETNSISRQPASNVRPAVEVGESLPTPAEARPDPETRAGPVRRSESAAEDRAGLLSFLAGAGLDAELADRADAEQVLFAVGELFRHAVAGLSDALAARSKLKGALRMDVTHIAPTGNNPIKFAGGGVEEAMEKLLFPRGKGYLAPVDAVREGFRDLQEHQLAMMSGLRASLDMFLLSLDPEVIEQSASSQSKKGFLTHRKGAAWDNYVARHADLKRRVADNPGLVIGAAFSEGYEQQLARLANAQQKERSKS